MADNESGCGCGALLLLGLVGLLLPVLPYILAFLALMAVLAGVVVGVGALLAEQSRRRLRTIAAAAEQRFGGDICRLEQAHGELTEIRVVAAGGTPPALRLSMGLRLLEEATEPGGDGVRPLQVTEQRREVSVQAGQLGKMASMGEFGRFLRSQGITMVNDLAVEARATRAALECVRERDWAQASETRLREMIANTRSTLSKAEGNELLEPSIPQLRQALSTFEAERDKLRRHHRESNSMLRKLHDYLTVPDAIRPILSFDLEGLFDPSRLRDLRSSFDEVVTLNDSYRALSRDRLA